MGNLINNLTNPLAHVVCRDGNGFIGELNKLPWTCKEDMKYFRTLTDNKIVIMGFNTFASINSYNSPNALKLETYNPVLKGRINIIIADPDRCEFPSQSLSLPNLIRTINGACIETGQEFKLVGFNIFVTSLHEAVSVATRLAKLVSDNILGFTLTGEWHVPVGKPVAYVIGGGKLYTETLETTYVSEIYETHLPIFCNVSDVGSATYYPTVDRELYISKNLMQCKATVNVPGRKPQKVDMQVIRHKRKIGLDSI